MFLDGCDNESEHLTVEGQIRGLLEWNEVGIGLTAKEQCPCPQATIARQASRVCGGNFRDGGSWLDSDKSACEFDVLALDLCSATVSHNVMPYAYQCIP